MKIIVKEEKNLIDYLVSNTDYTKTKIKSLLKYKNITVNGKVPLSHDYVLKKGQVVEISKEKKASKIGSIDIIYEDDNYLVQIKNMLDRFSKELELYFKKVGLKDGEY